MIPKIGELLGRQPEAYTWFIVDLITKRDRHGGYLVNDEASDYLNCLIIPSPVDPLLGEQLVILIKVNPKFADRIFKLLPHLNTWLTREQADGLFSWALKKSNTEFFKGHNLTLINLILEKELPINTSLHADWLVKLLTTNGAHARKILNAVPMLKKLLSQKKLFSLILSAAAKYNAAVVELIFELKITLDDSSKSKALDKILSWHPCPFPIIQLFVAYEGEFVFGAGNYARRIFLHAFACGANDLAHIIFEKLNMPMRHQLLLYYVEEKDSKLLENVVSDFLSEKELQELLVENNHQLILSSISNNRKSQFLLNNYWSENIYSLLMSRNYEVTLEKLAQIFLKKRNYILEFAITNNKKDILRGLLLLYAAMNVPLPPLTPEADAFILQLEWHNFNANTLLLSAREFNFLQGKQEGLRKTALPYVDYIDYLFKQLQRPLSIQPHRFNDELNPYTEDNIELISQRFTAKLNDENWQQWIPLDDDGKPTTYLGEIIFKRHDIFNNPIANVEELKQRINDSAADNFPQQNPEQEQTPDAEEQQLAQGQEQQWEAMPPLPGLLQNIPAYVP
jgi:hypothetical protein